MFVIFWHIIYHNVQSLGGWPHYIFVSLVFFLLGALTFRKVRQIFFFQFWSARIVLGQLGHSRKKKDQEMNLVWGMGLAWSCWQKWISQMGGLQGGDSRSLSTVNSTMPEIMAPLSEAFSLLWPMARVRGFHFFLCTLASELWIKGVGRMLR